MFLNNKYLFHWVHQDNKEAMHSGLRRSRLWNPFSVNIQATGREMEMTLVISANDLRGQVEKQFNITVITYEGRTQRMNAHSINWHFVQSPNCLEKRLFSSQMSEFKPPVLCMIERKKILPSECHYPGKHWKREIEGI